MGIGILVPSFGVISEVLSAVTSPVTEISGEAALWVPVQIVSGHVLVGRIQYTVAPDKNRG
jgi:hypothetical protein